VILWNQTMSGFSVIGITPSDSKENLEMSLRGLTEEQQVRVFMRRGGDQRRSMDAMVPVEDWLETGYTPEKRKRRPDLSKTVEPPQVTYGLTPAK
jgi:hypothetical protein